MDWLRRLCAYYSCKRYELAITVDYFLQLLYLTTGEWIRKIRYASGLTQESFAELLDVDPRTVQRWEANEQMPRGWRLYQMRKIEKDLIPSYQREIYDHVITIDDIRQSSSLHDLEMEARQKRSYSRVGTAREQVNRSIMV